MTEEMKLFKHTCPDCKIEFENHIDPEANLFGYPIVVYCEKCYKLKLADKPEFVFDPSLLKE